MLSSIVHLYNTAECLIKENIGNMCVKELPTTTSLIKKIFLTWAFPEAYSQPSQTSDMKLLSYILSETKYS